MRNETGMTFCPRIRTWLVPLLLTGCATIGPSRPTVGERSAARRTHENLHSVLWMQTSVEYWALAKQSYLRARAMLDEALADPSWTAALEQTGTFSHGAAAVILDVDETVLDNSPYAARLMTQGAEYSLATWHAWCDEAAARAVPGAVEFTRYAAERGVRVYYVTNRRHEVEESTRRNLEKLGFPLDPDRDTILTRGERPDWRGSDKGPRRKEVTSNHRVLLLIGDNLGDFVSAGTASVDERASIAEEYESYWGTRWIVLPNPQYGSWEEAILGFDTRLTDEEMLRIKYDALRTR